MYANEDIYTGTSDPNVNINPKITGAFYINKTTAKLFVCTDNTFNNNIWKICNPDITIPDPPMVFGHDYKIVNRYYGNTRYRNTTGYPMLGFVYGHSSYQAGDGTTNYTVRLFIETSKNTNIILTISGRNDVKMFIILPNMAWQYRQYGGYNPPTSVIMYEYSK